MNALSGIVVLGEPDPRAVENALMNLRRQPFCQSAELHIPGRLGISISEVNNSLTKQHSSTFLSTDFLPCVAVLGTIVNADSLWRGITGRDSAKRASSNDAELIGRLFLRDSIRGVTACEGEFCCCIWDNVSGRLYLIPDSHGLLPFYYFTGKHIFFSSSVKGVLCHSSVPCELEPEVLYELLCIGVVIPPRTCFRHVQILSGDKYLDVGHAISERTMPPSQEVDSNTLRTREERLSELHASLRDAILARVCHEPQLAVMLSGGIDSGALVGMLRHHTDIPFRTFTSVGTNGEMDRAAALATFWNTDHHPLPGPDRETMRLLPQAMWEAESPGVSSSNALAEMLFLRRIPEGSGLILSGDGNDLAWGLRAGITSNLLREQNIDFSSLYLRFRMLVHPRFLDRLLRPDLIALPRLLATIESHRDPKRILFDDLISVDMHVYGENGPNRMIGTIRMTSSAHQFAFPYFDRAYRRIIANLSEDERVLLDSRGKTVTKVLFREMVSRLGLVPSSVLNAPKSWIANPLSEALCGDLGGRMVYLLHARKESVIRQWCDNDMLMKMIAAHRKRRTDATFLLVTLLNLELLQALFVEQDSPDSVAEKWFDVR